MSKYIIEPWLPANQLHILGGSSGAGKTTLLFQLITQYPGFPRTLYISTDREAASYQDTMERLGIQQDSIDLISLIDLRAEQLREGTDSTLPVADWRPWLTRQLKLRSPRPEVVIADIALPITGISNINDMKQVYHAMTTLAAWCAVCQVTLILVWHSNKVREREDFLNVFNRLSGSHALLGCASTKAFLISEAESTSATRGPALLLQGQNFPDTPLELLRNSDGVFMLRGESLTAATLFQCFPRDGAIHVEDLIARSARSRPVIYRRLAELEFAGQVKRGPRRGLWLRV